MIKLKIFFLIGFINPVIATKNLISDEDKIEISNNERGNLQKNSYILGHGDFIGFKLFDIPELNTPVTILQDSTSSFPLIGTVDIDNLTIKQAEEKLTVLYKKEIIDPVVTIEVINPRPARVTLIGEEITYTLLCMCYQH